MFSELTELSANVLDRGRWDRHQRRPGITTHVSHQIERGFQPRYSVRRLTDCASGTSRVCNALACANRFSCTSERSCTHRSGTRQASASTPPTVPTHRFGKKVCVDTLLICSVTGLAILVTGAWGGGMTGAALSGEAFRLGLPGELGNVVVMSSILLFSFSTLIGWSYYGETAIVYLLGVKAAIPYRAAWLVFIYLGATGSLSLIWDLADTRNGLMAIPNLISVLGSIPLLMRLQREFFTREATSRAGR